MYLETGDSVSSTAAVSTFSNSLKKLSNVLISSFEIVSVVNNIFCPLLFISYVYIKYLTSKKLPFLLLIVKNCKIEFKKSGFSYYFLRFSLIQIRVFI